jgi:REP element-mobilizing transposase RayT
VVIGHHLVWTAYGWWLPNDPRGSSSREIRLESIAALGDLHYGRKSVPPTAEEIRDFFKRAKRVLAHAILAFDEAQVTIIADSFAKTIRERGYVCHACAIMPEHVHLLVSRHEDRAERMIAEFQEKSREALIAAGWRAGNHPVWGGPGWKVFQSTPQQMQSTARYVEDNPRERGQPAQQWDFVQPYDGRIPCGEN